MRGDGDDECWHVLRRVFYLLRLYEYVLAVFSGCIVCGYCAVIAAAGHSVRFMLMHSAGGGWHIVPATAAASVVIGILAVLVSPKTKVPAEAYLYPALLPMIPGVYAYRTFGALVMCLYNGGEASFSHYFYLFASNGLTCFFILLVMVVGATVPIFMMKKISFQATRHNSSL